MRLAQWQQSPYSDFYYYNPWLGRVVHRHLTRAHFELLPEARRGHMLVAPVRNPYDRVYSAFLQIQRDQQQQPGEHYPQPWIRSHVIAQLAESAAALRTADYDVNRWIEGLREEQVLEAGRNTSLPLHPNHYWTHRNGALAVDRLLFVEDFEVGFDNFAAALGLQIKQKGTANASPKMHAAPIGRYRYAGRLSPRSIARINELFARDFELFDYERL